MERLETSGHSSKTAVLLPLLLLWCQEGQQCLRLSST
jgi:hypothetical protein